MIPVLLILIPLVSGLICFLIREEKSAKLWSLIASIVVLATSMIGLTVLNKPGSLNFSAEWLPMLGSRFSVMMDGMGQLLCLLTALSFPAIFIATYNNTYRNG